MEQARQQRRGEEERRQQEAERHPAIEDLDEGQGHQADVEPPAAVADVDLVVAQLVTRMGEVAAAHLRQAGHARIHREALEIAGNLSRQRLEEDRPDRTRPDEVHAAEDDVQELRDLVELGALQHAPDARVEPVRVLEQARADPLLGADLERTELVDREHLGAAAETLAAIQDRALARELDADRDDEGERRQQHETDDRGQALPDRRRATDDRELDGLQREPDRLCGRLDARHPWGDGCADGSVHAHGGLRILGMPGRQRPRLALGGEQRRQRSGLRRARVATCRTSS